MTINCHSEKLLLENHVNLTQHNCDQSDNNVIFVFHQLLTNPKELLPILCWNRKSWKYVKTKQNIP